jgi:hypothetical protein
VLGLRVAAAVGPGDLLLEPAREELRSRALPPMNETPVLPAAMGPDSGFIGAAEMALEGARRAQRFGLLRYSGFLEGDACWRLTRVGALDDADCAVILDRPLPG